MPFLGSTPADQYQSLAKQTITGDGSTAYTLNRSVTNAYDMEVFINNVRQEPDTSYTASGNTITFTAAVTSGDSCYLIYQGQSVGSINPPANSVGSSQVANNTITTAHLHTGLSVPDSNIAAMSASKLTGNVAAANMPAGAVIQFKHSVNQNINPGVTFSGTGNSTIYYGANRGGRTYTEARSLVITPTSTSSILYCVGVMGWTSMAATSTMGHGQVITRNDGNDSIDNSDYPWYQHSYITGSQLYYPQETVIGVFSPASTSAQTIRLRPFVYIESGTATGGYNNASLFVMEIAG
jgi:hypothetical protein